MKDTILVALMAFIATFQVIMYVFPVMNCEETWKASALYNCESCTGK